MAYFMKDIKTSAPRIIGIILLTILVSAFSVPGIKPMIILPLIGFYFILGMYFPKPGIIFLFLSMVFPNTYIYLHLPWFSWMQVLSLSYLAGYWVKNRRIFNTWAYSDWIWTAFIIWTAILAIPVLVQGKSSVFQYYLITDKWRGFLEFLFIAPQGDYMQSIRVIMMFLTVFMLLKVIPQWINNPNDLKTLMIWFYMFAIPLLAFGGYQLDTGFGMHEFWMAQKEYRLNLIFCDPNSYATYLLVLIPITFGILLTSPKLGKLVIFLHFYVIWENLLFTGTSNGMYGLTLEILLGIYCIFLYFHNHKLPVRILQGFFGLLYTGVFLIPFTTAWMAVSYPRTTRIGQLLSDNGQVNHWLHGRMNIWKGAVRMVMDHPFVGVGPGQFNGHLIDYRNPFALLWNPEHENSHCYLVQIPAELGWLGLILFTIIFFYYLNQSGTSLMKETHKETLILKLCLLVSRWRNAD